VGTFAFLLALASALLAGFGAYRFYDGHSHENVGRVYAVVGFVGVVISGTIQQQQWADRNVDCQIFGRNCPTFGEILWDGIFKPMVVELVVVAAAVFVGFLIAKSTRREPAKGDERKDYFGKLVE
jgi:hypothetical protein